MSRPSWDCCVVTRDVLEEWKYVRGYTGRKNGTGEDARGRGEIWDKGVVLVGDRGMISRANYAVDVIYT
ncbi:MAG: hypothetical protein U0586_13595 [Candidatus Brocadiaceae bacterium]